MFDPALVRPILKELVELARPHFKGREAEALANLTAVDGSVFAALPRMAWALWMDDQHRGVKLHLQFQASKGVPGDAVLTPAACSEPAALTSMLEPGRLYVCDRGYASFELFRSILDAGSSLIVRVKDDITVNALEERPISSAAAQAGVVRDVILKRLGTSHHKDVVGRPMRLVVVKVIERQWQNQRALASHRPAGHGCRSGRHRLSLPLVGRVVLSLAQMRSRCTALDLAPRPWCGATNVRRADHQPADRHSHRLQTHQANFRDHSVLPSRLGQR